MEHMSKDVQAYTLPQLLELFKLGPGFTEEQLQLSRQRLASELALANSLKPKHEVLLFVDCACNRLRRERQPSNNSGTWEQKSNPLISGSSSHSLQESQNRIAGRTSRISEGRYADSNATPPGWLNPINIKTTDIALNVDSQFRKDYVGSTASDWNMDLPLPLNKVTAMRVASIQMPMSYYAVSMSRGNATFVITDCRARNADNINTFVANVGGTPGNATYDLSSPDNPVQVGALPAAFTELPPYWSSRVPGWLVTLPDGNYELTWQDLTGAEGLVGAMNTAFGNAIPGAYDLSTGRFEAFTTRSAWYPGGTEPRGLASWALFDVDRVSGKSIIGSALESTVPLGIHWAVDRGGNRDLNTSLQQKLGWMLGFRVGSYSSYGCATPVGAEPQLSTGYVSEAVCNVEGPKYLYLSITDGTNNHGSSLIGCFADSTFNKDIMLRVNLAAGTYGAKTYRYFSLAGVAGGWWRSRAYYGPVTIKKLRFRLFDEYGRLLDLNGLDWSMAIVFDQLYD